MRFRKSSRQCKEFEDWSVRIVLISNILQTLSYALCYEIDIARLLPSITTNNFTLASRGDDDILSAHWDS